MVVESSTSNLLVVEGRHDVFELRADHLAVRLHEAHLGHMLAQERGHLVEIGDARHDIEALAAAIALAQQRLA